MTNKIWAKLISVSLLSFILFLSLGACDKDRQIHMQETEQTEDIDQIIIPIKNCKGGAEIESEASYEMKIDVRGASELGLEIDVVKAKLTASLGLQTGYTIRHIVKTPPGMRGQHMINFQVTILKGLIFTDQSSKQATYAVRVPKSFAGVESVLEKCPTDSSDRCSDESYERLAAAQREEVQMLIEGKPDAPTRIFETLGRIDEAIKTCPTDARFHMLKGYVLKDVYQSRTPLLSVEQRRDYLFRAQNSVEQALKLDPNNVGAHNLMGNVLFFEGDCNAAIREYDRALELNRDSGYRKIIEGDKQLAVQARDNNTCTVP